MNHSLDAIVRDTRAALESAGEIVGQSGGSGQTRQRSHPHPVSESHIVSFNPSSVDFYRASEYCTNESVSYLMKRVICSIAHLADERLASYGLTSTQARTLLNIKIQKYHTVAELARELQVDAGAMTRLLGRLEEKGLCRRVRSTGDRRIVMVEMTQAGEAAITKVPVVMCEILNLHLADFSRSEWQTLQNYLHRMLANGEALRESTIDSAFKQ